jgi:hypothetical protein
MVFTTNIAIVATTTMLNPIRSSEDKAYKMQKLFNEGSFMAYGVVDIPKGTEKPSKSSKDTAMVGKAFCLIYSL